MAGGNYDRSQKKSQLNPAVSYAFALQVEAAFFLPLKSVRVFTKENEFDQYQEGGLNDYVHMLRKPISKPFTFQVERYVGVDAGFLGMNSGFIDPLALGTDLVLPLILYVNRSPAGKWYQNISFTNCARAYVFTGCTVQSKEYGELNAEQSKLLTETTTIIYRELFVLNQISPDWEKGGVWKMKAGDYKGEGESHADNRSKNDEKSKMEGKGKDNLWVIDKEKPEGTGKSHDTNKSKNDKKSDMESKGKGNLWTIDKEKPEGTGKSHDTNKSKNDKKSDMEGKGKENLWVIDAEKPEGTGKAHEQNRSKNADKAAAEYHGRRNKWGYPGATDDDLSTPHEENHSKNDSKSDMEDKGKDNQWIYDGTVKGDGKAHEGNRSTNTKPTPVTWPPTRRALMAQALSET